MKPKTYSYTSTARPAAVTCRSACIYLTCCCCWVIFFGGRMKYVSAGAQGYFLQTYDTCSTGAGSLVSGSSECSNLALQGWATYYESSFQVCGGFRPSGCTYKTAWGGALCYFATAQGATGQNLCTMERRCLCKCPFGTTTDTAEPGFNVETCKCAPGRHLTKASADLREPPTCEACASGRYHDQINLDSECKSCPKGKYCTSAGNLPIPCNMGKYGDQLNQLSESSCKTCEVGYYCAGEASRTECGAGKYGDVPFRSTENQCKSCTAGYYCTGGAAKDACGAGKYNDQASQSLESSCKTCEVGYYCAGLDSQTACGPGKYSDQVSQSSESSCKTCEEGYYCAGLDSRTACGAGKYGDETSRSAENQCKSCITGYYCTGGTATDACGAGKYSVQPSQSSESSCKTCEVGYYCTGSDSRTACAQGKYSLQESQSSESSCKTCENVPTVLPAACNTDSAGSCPQGRYGTTESLCKSCEKGYYCTGGIAKAACGEGKYSDQESQSLESSCKTCEVGYYCAGKNLTSACGSGKYGDQFAQSLESSCKSCEVGYYCAGKASRTACEAGKYGDETSRSAKKPCKSCIVGYYCTGGTANIACGAGNYSDQALQSSDSSCKTCEVGYYCTGGKARTACGPGKYSDQASQSSESSCKTCEVGYYCAGEDARTACGSGKYSNETGRIAESSCKQCTRGYYCPNSTLKLPCKPGTFGGERGFTKLTECRDCLPGHYCAGVGNTQSHPCPLGRYGAGGKTEQTSFSYCKLCPDHKRGIAEGQNTADKACASCPDHEYLDATLQKCKKCPKAGVLCSYGAIRLIPGFQQQPWSTSQPRAIHSNTVFFKCPNPQACPACQSADTTSCDIGDRRNRSLIGPGCADEYRGFVCAKCARQYGLGMESRDRLKPVCKRCPSVEGNIVLFVALAALMLGLFLVLLKRRKHKRRASLERVFITYLQFMSYARLLNVKWPNPFKNMIETHTFLATPLDPSMFNLDCLTQQSSIYNSSFFTQAAFVVWVATAVHAAVISFSLRQWYVAKDDEAKKREVVNTAIRIMAVFEWFAWSSITQSIFEMLSCRSYGEGPLKTLRLRMDLDIQCFGSNHWKGIGVIVIPGLLLHVIGAPALISWDVRRMYKSARRSQEGLKRLVERYGFLISGYSQNSYYWELTVLGRRFGIIFACAFLCDTPVLQCNVITSICAISVAAHALVHPYGTNEFTILSSAAASHADDLCKKAFSFIDIDKSGTITADEIQKLLEQYGHEISKEASETFAQCSKEEITFDDFKSMVKSPSNSLERLVQSVVQIYSAQADIFATDKTLNGQYSVNGIIERGKLVSKLELSALTCIWITFQFAPPPASENTHTVPVEVLSALMFIINLWFTGFFFYHYSIAKGVSTMTRKACSKFWQRNGRAAKSPLFKTDGIEIVETGRNDVRALTVMQPNLLFQPGSSRRNPAFAVAEK